MSEYRSGDSTARGLEKIATKSYIVPSIQRDFVWKHKQIEKLFDSLMQGYPVGTLLFWQISPEVSEKFNFYEFARYYDERDTEHSTPLDTIDNKEVIAVLDSQQRLTALNIGLRGSLQLKLSQKHWNNPDAFPVKYLYLDLISPTVPDDEGRRYKFQFLSDSEIKKKTRISGSAFLIS